MTRVYGNIHEAYLSTLEDVYTNYEHRSSPRGLPIREKLDYTFKVLNPSSEPIKTKDEERNATIATYTEKEKALYNSGSCLVEDFSKASKFWEKLANPDGTINSAYGYLIWHNRSHGHPYYESGESRPHKGNSHTMRTPWEWCAESLKRDKDTRQAILRFSLPQHAYLGVKDFTCTMHGNFLIRDDKLNFSIVMRSNDIVKGLTYDMPWFCSLMDKMVEELKPFYPNLTKGSYTHTVHSIHLYEKDEATILKMLKSS
jgi:thymidylate synthase